MRFFQVTSDLELARRAETLAFRLLIGPNSLAFGVPFAAAFGVLGVGLHLETGRLLLAVSPRRLGIRQLVAAFEVPGIETLFALIAQPGERFDDILAWGAEDIEPQIATGDHVTGGAPGHGTLGAPVHWSGGSRHGMLTAGHVVRTATSVLAGGIGASVPSGTSLEPAASGGLDVAIIELSAPSSSPPLRHAARPIGPVAVELLKHSPVADYLVTYMGWFYSSGLKLTYIDLFETHGLISSGGDSGAAVVLAGTDEFVGTLIGQSTGSLIQDGESQIDELANLVDPSGAKRLPSLQL